MAIRRYPDTDNNSLKLVMAFQPQGSTTVISLRDAAKNQRLPMLAWGKHIYAPVYTGMSFAVEVYNGSNQMRAYPSYIEAANIWTGGPSQPEECDTDHMWEVHSGRSQSFDAVMNPNAQRGRPMIITESGFGNTVGEATFGTDAFRGQVRIYERLPIFNSFPQQRRGTNEGHGLQSYVATCGGDSRGGDFDSPLEGFRGGSPQSFGESRSKGGLGHAGIGLGEEENRSHRETGVTYQRQAEPVVFIRTEFREDLAQMVYEKTGQRWDFNQWTGDVSNWWSNPWGWGSVTPPTAPAVPITPKPHVPRG